MHFIPKLMFNDVLLKNITSCHPSKLVQITQKEVAVRNALYYLFSFGFEIQACLGL